MVVSDSDKCLGCVAACFSNPSIHGVDFASLWSQHSSFKLIFGLY